MNPASTTLENLRSIGWEFTESRVDSGYKVTGAWRSHNLAAFGSNRETALELMRIRASMVTRLESSKSHIVLGPADLQIVGKVDEHRRPAAK